MGENYVFLSQIMKRINGRRMISIPLSHDGQVLTVPNRKRNEILVGWWWKRLKWDVHLFKVKGSTIVSKKNYWIINKKQSELIYYAGMVINRIFKYFWVFSSHFWPFSTIFCQFREENSTKIHYNVPLLII